MDKTNNVSGGTDKARRYKTAIIDPPWTREQGGTYGANRHYPLMPLDQIKAMPIKDLMEEDSHVWLWNTITTTPVKRRWLFIDKNRAY